MPELTAIVPVDLSQRPLDIIIKANRLANIASKAGINIIFGHNDRGTLADAIFKKLVRRYERIKISSCRLDSDEINSSLLRNIAARLVQTKYILLLDVDIWPDFSTILQYLGKVTRGETPFQILPCLYLTKAGSKLLTSGAVDSAELAKRFIAYSRKEFLHLASPSSVTILELKDYQDLLGFDERFKGHGYEDFDFLIRLALHYNLITPGTDFLVDKSARSPLFAVGFRKDLGTLCLSALMKFDVVFHLHHDKPRFGKYHAARPNNYSLFATKHQARVDSSVRTPQTLISVFEESCLESGQDIHKLSVLYDNKPGHVDRFDTLKRRIRFLINAQ